MGTLIIGCREKSELCSPIDRCAVEFVNSWKIINGHTHNAEKK